MNQDDKYRFLSRILMMRVDAGFQLGSRTIWNLIACIENRSVFIVEDVVGGVVGYVTWANVNKYSLRRLIKFNKIPEYTYEYREGKCVLITDACFFPGNEFFCLKKIKRHFADRKVIAFKANNTISLRLYNRIVFRRNLINDPM